MSSPETDATLRDAGTALARIRGDLQAVPGADRRRQANVQAIGRRLTRIAIADAAIVALAIVVGLVTPLGLMGALGVLVLLIAATLLLAIWPAERAPAAEALRTVDLQALPRQTGRWLEAQRPALPAPAVTVADRIGARLAQLEPQLAALPGDAPAGDELRKLVGEQLPDFMRDYQRVPAGLRGVERNGRTPDAQLTDGLRLIERQLADLTEQLAQGDLDSLETRGRYLELKYQGEQ